MILDHKLVYILWKILIWKVLNRISFFKLTHLKDWKRYFKCPFLQRWQCPIHNGTLRSVCYLVVWLIGWLIDQVSDDEDDTHPNIDTPSLFKWRHEARVQRMEDMQKKKVKFISFDEWQYPPPLFFFWWFLFKKYCLLIQRMFARGV